MSEALETPTNDGTIKADFTATIVGNYLSNNNVQRDDVPGFIEAVANSYDRIFGGGAEQAQPEQAKQEPAVSIRRSITPDYLISLEDGSKLKSLKRHLMTKYGMTPDQYRAKWGLPKDYPMVAPNYAKARSDLAKQMGLGRGGRNAAKSASSAPKNGQRKGQGGGRRKAQGQGAAANA